MTVGSLVTLNCDTVGPGITNADCAMVTQGGDEVTVTLHQTGGEPEALCCTCIGLRSSAVLVLDTWHACALSAATNLTYSAPIKFELV